MATGRSDNIEVLYVMGTSRSGSTILDISLGCHPGLAGFGELNNFIHQGWVKREYCSCGVPGPECEFWRSVVQDWLVDDEISTPEKYLALQRRIESPLGLGPILARGWYVSKDFGMYARCTRRLLNVLREHSRRPVIIDSSKSPLRALALSGIEGVDLKVIHIVRDPRGVAWSQKKRFARDLASGLPKNTSGQPVWYTAASWLAVNALAEVVRAILGKKRTLMVRYEDFVQDFEGVQKRIGTLVDRDLGSLSSALEKDIDLSKRHQIAGNRVRMSTRIRLKLDEEWKTGLSASELTAIEMAARPLMSRYGYLSYRGDLNQS